MRVSGNSARMAINASMPFKSGMLRSISVTSGGAPDIAESRPFRQNACETSTIAHRCVMMHAIASRRSAWSSTLSTRVRFRSIFNVSFFISSNQAFPPKRMAAVRYLRRETAP